MKRPKGTPYWKRRFAIIEDATDQVAKKSIEDIEYILRMAQREAERHLRAWWQKFAVNNSVNLTQAHQLMTRGELQEFRWTLQEYIRRASDLALSQEWQQELVNAAARVHVRRYEALLVDIEQALEEAAGGSVKVMDKGLEAVYMDTGELTTAALVEGLGVRMPGERLFSRRRFEAARDEPWLADALTWSDRIWVNKGKVARRLQQEFMVMAATGDSIDASINAIEKTFKTTRHNAARLVQTEYHKIAEDASHDSMRGIGVNRYQLMAVLDERTSVICQSMDGQHFAMEDRAVGLNAPPFHPWCRTVSIPYIDDEFEREWEQAAS